MDSNLTRIIEGTFTVILLAWVLTHATEFGQAVNSISGAYNSGVGVLMPKQ